MARLKNNRNQPLQLYYVSGNGRKKVQIPSQGTMDVPDFIKPVSNGEVLNGWLVIMSETDVKMMDAENDVMSYIESDSRKK
jgi:hypothetical protein